MDLPIYFNVTSTHFNIKSYENILFEKILMKASIKNDILLIGEEYICCDSYMTIENKINYEKYTKKVVCEIDINNGSKEVDFLKKNGYGKNKVGSLIFLKEDADDNGLVHRDATVVFQLFLNNEFFTSIYENLKLKNKISSIRMEIEKIEYGHVFDNRIKKWSLTEPIEKYSHHSVNISDVNFVFEV
jgi:hypothetical protein